jgi:signal transduction histidine kinase
MVNHKLSEQIEQRIEFTRALVHELKTPLTPLLGTTDLLCSGLKEDPWSDFARQAYKGTLVLNKRINELYELTKSEIGTLELKYTSVRVVELIDDIVKCVTPLAAEKEHALSMRVSKDIQLLYCDQQRLEQILLNLLNNAIIHTPKGTAVSLQVKQEDSCALFMVKDNGPGMSRDRLSRLFKPYARFGSNNDREHISGLGLGLALCKSLVELHHGHIWVKSTPGKGSSFYFKIPINEHIK